MNAIKSFARGIDWHRSDIDGLRAVAVSAVVAFHAFPQLVHGGFVGVDIFFVVSGYLISYIVVAAEKNGKFSFIDFYIRRIRRIFPALLIVLLTCFAVGWQLLDEGDFGFLGKHIAGGSVFASNFVLWKESGYFDSDGSVKPLLHLWSLGIEEQFYIIWPAIVLLAIRCRWQPLLTIGVGLIASFAYNVWLISVGSAGAYYSPFSRFWELLVGSIGACLVYDREMLVQRWQQRFGNTVSLVSMALIAGSIFMLNKNLSFPGWWAVPSVAGALGLLLAGPHAFINRHVLSQRAAVWIGLISFPLYLWHWPILTFWKLVSLTKATVPETLGMIALAIVLSYLVYEFVERPARRYGEKKIAVALVILLLGAGYTGYDSYIRGGLPFRSVVKQELNHYASEYLAAPPTALDCSVIEDSNFVVPKACMASTEGLSKPLVFLWGDSHTANVSYGLTSDKLRQLDIRLAVAMKGGCPPVIGYQPTTPSRCADFYDRSLEKIKALEPDVVILIGSWSLYFEQKGCNKLDNDSLIATVDSLKKMGVKKVIIVGSFPVFDINQAKLGARLFKPHERDRTFDRFDTSLYEIDERVKDIAREAHAEFISPLEYLCDKDGCLISASSATYIPMAYDLSHMTYPGSEYFVDNAINKATFTQHR